MTFWKKVGFAIRDVAPSKNWEGGGGSNEKAPPPSWFEQGYVTDLPNSTVDQKMEISCNMVQTLRWKLKVTVRPMQVMLVIRTHLNQMSNHYWRLKKSRGTLLMSTMRPQIMRGQRRRRKDVLSAAVVLIKYF